jgi:hypothetical protein
MNEHIKNVYLDGELAEGVSMRKFGISEFSTKPTNYCSRDMIISVGYRVKSVQGTQLLSESDRYLCHQHSVRSKGLYSCHQCQEWPCSTVENFGIATGPRVMKRTIPIWRANVGYYRLPERQASKFHRR